MESVHKTVLLKETIDGLHLKDGDLVLDMTFGGGGHSFEVLSKFPFCKVIALDQDEGAWERSKHKFNSFLSRIKFIPVNFRNAFSTLSGLEIESVDGVIFDLGLSSDQLEEGGRGFTFLKDEPLLMTMKKDLKEEDTTAYDIVNTWDKENIESILRGYGEEKFAKRIAEGIEKARKEKPIKTTLELVSVIEQNVPFFYKKQKIHFATRTFQALRIAVNDELNALKDGLNDAFQILNQDKRMAVISFHSLEDRIVKNFFIEKVKNGEASFTEDFGKKPFVPTEEEIKENKRSRSAKLRVLKKII